MDSNDKNGSFRVRAGGSGQASQRIRRRNRMITSCLECRRRKLKCDKAHPCVNCTKGSRDCVFLAPALDSTSQLKLAEVKEKMGSLEMSLEQDIAKTASWRGLKRSSSDDEDEIHGIPEDERNLKHPNTAVNDAVFEDDEGDDDTADLGYKIGKLRLTDRIGGFFRPAIMKEMNSFLVGMEESESGEQLTAPIDAKYLRPSNFMAPGPNYIPPFSDFFLSLGSFSLIHFLPSRAAADRLLKHYWYAVHPITRTVHGPSFKERYSIFWNEIGIGIEPVPSLQAVVFAMLFMSAISMDDDKVLQEFGAPKADLVKNFQQALETALVRAKFMRTTKLETMQAFVMYLLVLCRDELSRAHSAIVSAAIKLGECMGLQKDGADFALQPVETHIRRLLWHQLLFMDMRTCEARGPRLVIHEGEYETREPVNLDDDQIAFSSSQPSPTIDKWTEMTFAVMRVQIQTFSRQLWYDRAKVQKGLMTLTDILIRVEKYKRELLQIYVPLLREGTPLQQFARVWLDSHIHKLYISTLHIFHMSGESFLPPRLRKVVINAATGTLEATMLMETLPALHTWKWYSCTWYPLGIAFLLVADFYVCPDWSDPTRTWRVLDWVFEPPIPADSSRPLSYERKARLILVEIYERMKIYMDARRIKVPTELFKNVQISADKAIANVHDLRRKSKDEAISHSSVGGRSSGSPRVGCAESGPPGTGSLGKDEPSSTLSVATSTTSESLSPRMPNFAGDSPSLFPDFDFNDLPVSSQTENQNPDREIVPQHSMPGFPQTMQEMPDIDWNEWDKLFPAQELGKFDLDMPMWDDSLTLGNSFGPSGF